MIESKELNENASQTASISNEKNEVVSGKIVAIRSGEVRVKYGDGVDDIAVIPMSRLAAPVVIGNCVKFRVEEKNGSKCVTEVLYHGKPDKADDTNVVSGTIESIVADFSVTVKFGDDEFGSIPYDKFSEKPSVGDIIKVRVTKDNDKFTITEVVSHIKQETEVVEGKVAAIETDVIVVAIGADVLVEIPSQLFDSIDVSLDDTVKMNVVNNDNRMVVKSLVSVTGSTGETIDIEQSAATEHPTDDKPENDEASESNDEKDEDEITLQYIDKEFMLDVMSVPTHSKLEARMTVFIMMWARRNNVKIEYDDFGNIYLTKGELAEGEYYPCVTSHLDTVQYKHDPYIYAGVPLALKIEKTKDGDHKLFVDNEGGSLGTEIGIGADCKSGICICLSLFDHFEKLKACFFLDEEEGCVGSEKLDVDWFNNVGYVIGFDSPDLYRAAWSCSGTKLFNYSFYETWMKPVCDEWGLTTGCFFSEPYTDVKEIREKTDIICMNFGNGGYNAHNIGGTEYCIMEDMDQACGMGIDLIDYIGCTCHMLKHRTKGTSSYVKDKNGVWSNDGYDTEDDKKLESLGDNKRNRWGYNSSSSSSSSSSSNSSSSSSSSSSSTETKKPVNKDDEIKFEVVKYITTKYESHINGIKEDVLEDIKSLCASKGIDFSDFEKVVTNNFSNEVKF